jgi:hypothetical protein
MPSQAASISDLPPVTVAPPWISGTSGDESNDEELHPSESGN